MVFKHECPAVVFTLELTLSYYRIINTNPTEAGETCSFIDVILCLIFCDLLDDWFPSVSLFFSEFLQSSSPQRQYHLITKQKSWPSAQAYCREHYADLATVENQVDRNNIQREAQRLGLMSEAWVGLWRCSRDEVPLGSWSKWQTDQPNNVFGKDQCVIIFQDKRWYDISCSSKHSFICYDGEKYFMVLLQIPCLLKC
uniref:C-type lectin domain-containing protein n=1 Tax=Astyanax mexicanus TaxID=7994 RepID=A0A8B9LQ72_ASTMX